MQLFWRFSCPKTSQKNSRVVALGKNSSVSVKETERHYLTVSGAMLSGSFSTIVLGAVNTDARRRIEIPGSHKRRSIDSSSKKQRRGIDCGHSKLPTDQAQCKEQSRVLERRSRALLYVLVFLPAIAPCCFFLPRQDRTFTSSYLRVERKKR